MTSATTTFSVQEPGLRHARCMRAHGVANFPDPDPSLRFQLPEQLPDNYEQAKATCEVHC